MALTPEDVVNKRFQPTKFREGYDQDEVDDFLDEVVVELRRLNQENEELRQRLVASDSRISELQRSGAAQPQQPVFAQQPEPVIAPVPAPAPAAAPAYAAADANPMDPGNTNNLLQLARRLHEEHVREGVEKRDALIAEGHATAARVVAEAEARQRSQLGSLDQERQQLEHRIDELRNFEREYRQKLKGYIEGQLRELDSANVLTAAPAAAAAGPVSSFTEAPTSSPFSDAPTDQGGADSPAQQPFGENQPYGEAQPQAAQPFGENQPYGEAQPQAAQPQAAQPQAAQPFGESQPQAAQPFGENQPYGEAQPQAAQPTQAFTEQPAQPYDSQSYDAQPFSAPAGNQPPATYPGYSGN